MKSNAFTSSISVFSTNLCFRSAMLYFSILQLQKGGFKQKYKMTELPNGSIYRLVTVFDFPQRFRVRSLVVFFT